METRKRTLAKTMSWRVIATVITMVVAFGVSGDPLVGIAVGSGDFVIKIFAYYFHERAWSRVTVGYVADKANVDKGAGI